MPYRIRKVRNKNCYSVRNLKNRKLVSKCTSRNKAKSQLRLLYALDYNKDFLLKTSSDKSSNNVTRKKN